MVQDLGQYRWIYYRHNGLGQAEPRITTLPVFLALDRNGAARQTACRALFRSEVDEEALAEIRLTLPQVRPLGQGAFR